MLDKIKKDQLEARLSKSKVKASLLTTLIGEASPSGNDKAPDVIAVIRKFVKNTKELFKHDPSNEKAKEELQILEYYLPKVKSTQEHVELVSKLVEDNTFTKQDMGKFMGLLNKESGVDKALASKLFRELT